MRGVAAHFYGRDASVIGPRKSPVEAAGVPLRPRDRRDPRQDRQRVDTSQQQHTCGQRACRLRPQPGDQGMPQGGVLHRAKPHPIAVARI